MMPSDSTNAMFLGVSDWENGRGGGRGKNIEEWCVEYAKIP